MNKTGSSESEALNLTSEERRKFALYLKADAETDAKIGKRMERTAQPEPMIQHYWDRAAAKALVAHELLSIEDMTIG